ncbi:hypothetical protein BU204_28735 [Actinophytocola xanthii]|uniref:Uncharacterized protein n=1 Tax=Actinophytocola xanthii TaxID=1912961 RepID=A0A1Q8CE60_9PSEU|nr:hypothetical protein BU204_28735 [Actinophytocola xanthii]
MADRSQARSETLGDLPRRGGARTATQPPRPRQHDPAEGGQTANGLPRRVSRSIKSPDHREDASRPAAPPPAPAPPDRSAEQAGHEKLLADLDAFTAGEAAAKADRRAGEPDAVTGASPAGQPEPDHTRWPNDLDLATEPGPTPGPTPGPRPSPRPHPNPPSGGTTP